MGLRALTVSETVMMSPLAINCIDRCVEKTQPIVHHADQQDADDGHQYRTGSPVRLV